MHQKCLCQKFSGRLGFISLLLFCSCVLCSAQGFRPQSETEIRAALNQSRSKDQEIADKASEKLSRLEIRDKPVLIRTMMRGRVCERVGAAAIIVSLEHDNKDVLPILTELSTGGSGSSTEEELLCRRGATYQLGFSTAGIRLLTRLLKDGKNFFIRQSAIFAFDELTETANYPEGSLEAMKDAIPVIAASGKLDDEVMQNMSNEVLWQIIKYGGDELSKTAKKYVDKNP